MLVSCYFDGIKSATSSKGNTYGDIFCRGMREDGTADFEQMKFRTFDEAVIKKANGLQKDDIINLELTIRDATCSDISK